MKRTAKTAAVCVGIIAVFAFFFLVPVVPTTVVTYELYSQHGWCSGALTSPPQTSGIYASVSYALFHSGEVYVPSSGYLWWLLSSGYATDCA